MEWGSFTVLGGRDRICQHRDRWELQNDHPNLHFLFGGGIHLDEFAMMSGEIR